MAQVQQKGFVSRITDYMAHPFSTQMSLVNWFLWVGIVIVMIVLWTRILRHIHVE